MPSLLDNIRSRLSVSSIRANTNSNHVEANGVNGVANGHDDETMRRIELLKQIAGRDQHARRATPIMTVRNGQRPMMRGARVRFREMSTPPRSHNSVDDSGDDDSALYTPVVCQLNVHSGGHLIVSPECKTNSAAQVVQLRHLCCNKVANYCCTPRERPGLAANILQGVHKNRLYRRRPVLLHTNQSVVSEVPMFLLLSARRCSLCAHSPMPNVQCSCAVHPATALQVLVKIMH